MRRDNASKRAFGQNNSVSSDAVLLVSPTAVNISENVYAVKQYNAVFRLLRSTPFRLGMVFSLIYIVVFSIAGVVFYDFIKDRILQRVDNSLIQSYKSFNEVYQELGIDAVVQLAKSKDNVPMQDSMGFHLANSDGFRMAGNLPNCSTDLGWSEVEGSELGLERGNQYRFYTEKLGNNTLSLGRSLDSVTEMRQNAYAGFSQAFFIAMILALLGSAYMAYRMQCRIKGITLSMDKVAAGDLSARIPVSASAHCDIDEFSMKINDALKRLEMNVEGMRQVSSDVAHDLKTPLNRLHIALEQAIEKLQGDGVVNEELQSALGEAQSINATFAALLRIAQIEAGSRRAKFKNFNLTRLIDTVLEVYAPVAEESNQRLIVADDLPELELWGDSNLLMQMLANLIENSIRHCPAKTVIRLESGISEKGVWICVSDNGPGIPVKLQRKVFQRLFRIEKHRQTSGTGLGLSLVKAVAELHCGHVIIDDNNPGLRVLIQFEDTCRYEISAD